MGTAPRSTGGGSTSTSSKGTTSSGGEFTGYALVVRARPDHLFLEKLDLRSNQLSYLPTAISQLRNLKHLDASENLLVSLEPSICDLHELEKLELKDNPLQKPPISIARQGIGSIRRYFQELAASGETPSNGARLVLLGHGEAGKTSLQRGLRAGAASQAVRALTEAPGMSAAWRAQLGRCRLIVCRWRNGCQQSLQIVIMVCQNAGRSLSDLPDAKRIDEPLKTDGAPCLY